MQYNDQLETLADFYDTIYAIPARLTRDEVTPKAVTKQLLAALGNPQTALRSILITGSKGKGSSAIMLSQLLISAGQKVGQFSSPHLFDFRERIVVNNEMIEPHHLLSLAKKVFAAANALPIKHSDEFPRFFEVTTAIAYLYFAQRHVDYAVIETGIGALTDATNQDSHQLSILTNIESEHLDIFGDLSSLAAEKSGVMLPNVPLILGDLSEKADQLIIEQAAKLNVPVTRFKRSFIINNNGFYPVPVGQSIWISDSLNKAKNAWVALAAFKQLGIELTEEEIINTLQQTRLPAREEIVSKTPFVIIDGAHTRKSAESLANYVEKSVTTPIKKKVLLVSFSAKKNIKAVLSAFPDVDKIVITQATESRSLCPEKIQGIIEKLNSMEHNPKIRVIKNPVKALTKTLKKLETDDALIITGSVYLAGLASQQL